MFWLWCRNICIFLQPKISNISFVTFWCFVANFSLSGGEKKKTTLTLTVTLVSDTIQQPKGRRDIYMLCHDHFSKYSLMFAHFQVKMRLKPPTKHHRIVIWGWRDRKYYLTRRLLAVRVWERRCWGTWCSTVISDCMTCALSCFAFGSIAVQRLANESRFILYEFWEHNNVWKK